MTEYIVISGLASVLIYTALMGTTSSSNGNVIVANSENQVHTQTGNYVKATQVPCVPQIDKDLSTGVANLIVNRQSCVRKSLFSL